MGAALRGLGAESGQLGEWGVWIELWKCRRVVGFSYHTRSVSSPGGGALDVVPWACGVGELRQRASPTLQSVRDDDVGPPGGFWWGGPGVLRKMREFSGASLSADRTRSTRFPSPNQNTLGSHSHASSRRSWKRNLRGRCGQVWECISWSPHSLSPDGTSSLIPGPGADFDEKGSRPPPALFPFVLPVKGDEVKLSMLHFTFPCPLFKPFPSRNGTTLRRSSLVL